jgi:thiol:disulfide interchange protein
MKRSFLLLLPFLLFCFHLCAQIQKPVKWTFSEKRDKDVATLVFTASIDKGWHVYSLFASDGPTPTSFNFEKSDAYELVGPVKESKPEEHFDETFGAVVKFFSDRAVFKQKIRIKSDKDFQVKGVLNYMVCNDKMCLPPEDVEFVFDLKGEKASSASGPVVGNDIGHAAAVPSKSEEAGGKGSPTPVSDEKKIGSSDNYMAGRPVMSLWKIFFEGLIGGFLALLTPCVFPMIPLTVSFFTKKDHSRVKGAFHAGIYGMSIVLIYVFLGFVVTKLLGADALNDLASNGIFNMIFFLLLVVFAASFLGAFEITLPSSWVNTADSRSDKGGLVGIFFMAFTLALVSFSCTGPIIGTLLVEAASGKNNMGPLAGMAGFSVALALPFAFFAAFPSMMKTLPKSGGWLNSVKVVLGFLELALAMKFLSNVDLAYHWRILDREVFLVIWIVLFTLLGFYLIGKLKFSHDSDLKYISIPRLFLAIICFSFSLYMIPGLWGAPLKAISAFSPPQATQDFDLSRVSSDLASEQNEGERHEKVELKKHAGIFHCPHGLDCFFDYEDGMAYAKKVNKPLFIDFTGWSCVNCRKMEVSVWSDPMVLKRLKEDFVMMSLYVDDKTVLPENEQYISKFSGKKIKTLGNKWSDLQASRFGTNSQPYYVILDHEGNPVTSPHAFDLSIENYVKFLDSGKQAYDAKKKNN